MKVISTVALQPAHRAAISSAVPGVELADRQCRTAEEVAEFVSGGCDALLTFRVPNDIATRARGLKWIQLLSAGADHVLSGALKGTTIPITTASGIHATPIAEYTLASMLAYAHRIHLAIRAQTRREWLRSGAFMGSVDEIRGRTLGIVGYGSIGRETARLAAAFGMKVLALKRNPADRVDPGWSPAGLGDPDGKIPAHFFGPDEREAILRESDYVSVTLPLTDHTRKFIVEHEPLESSSPLWDLENVILTPHISGANRGYMDKACELFAENLKRFAADRPLLNVVDPSLGY